ncbi:MAG: hypothetical protein LBV02_07230 [Bacteroidales bacterium]|jgi:hypothetical protein|nr:hypothetical protein [Bacteroidales bacterium]
MFKLINNFILTGCASIITKKTFILLYLVSQSFLLSSQTSLYKTWVGEGLEVLELGEKRAKYTYDVEPLNYLVELEEDSVLVLTTSQWRSGKAEQEVKKLAFDILRLTKDSLVLAPLNHKAWRALSKNEQYHFVSKSSLYDSSFHFRKIRLYVYPSERSTEPGIEMEIDSSGYLCFHTTQRIGVLKGTYLAQLSDELFRKLTTLAQTAPLSKLPEQFGTSPGIEIYEIIIDFDDNQRIAKGNISPYLYKPFIDFLLSIYLKAELKQ